MSATDAIAERAAMLIAEEGLSREQAKRKAAKQLDLSAQRTPMPNNTLIDARLLDYLNEQDPEGHAQRLIERQTIAQAWIDRLEQALPHHLIDKVTLIGALSQGIAAPLGVIQLEVHTPDTKHFEIACLDAGIRFEHGENELGQSMLSIISTLIPMSCHSSSDTPIVLTLIERQ